VETLTDAKNTALEASPNFSRGFDAPSAIVCCNSKGRSAPISKLRFPNTTPLLILVIKP